jgi:hypothetical protein
MIGLENSVSDDELKNWYVALPEADKQIFLALVSNHLTIHGRAFGIDLAGPAQSRAFQGLNELQHQISGHIAAIGVRRDRYPDEALWEILHEKAATYALLAHLKQSLDFARSRDSWGKLKDADGNKSAT